MIAIYVRVSSKAQDAASQLPDLQRWAKAQSEPVEWYRDKFTGKTMDRPGWTKLWAGVLAARIDKVVIWRLDRLGRTTRGLTALFEELLKRNVTLVSVREGFDLKTPAGRMLAVMLAGVAAYETEVRSERQLAGIAAAKDRGVVFGRRPGPGKRIKVTGEQEEIVRQLYTQGKPIAGIARATGLSRPTVYKILGPKGG